MKSSGRLPLLLGSLAVSLLAVPLAGCNEEFVDCMNEWQECTSKCGGSEGCREACDEKFAECVDGIGVCGDVPSTQYYAQVSIPDWNLHDDNRLLDPSQTVLICEDHFPPGSPEGDIVESGIEAYDTLIGSSVALSAGWDSHLDKVSLFIDPPTVSRYDYADNAGDAFPHTCHLDNETECGDDFDAGIDGWTMNTCKFGGGDWNQGDPVDFFTVTANASCWAHFADPASSEYPDIGGVEHELGHAFGMSHTPTWPPNDQKYISTMQGKLEFLSAYDVAFLRHFFPQFTPLMWQNYVASSKIRTDWGTPTEVDMTFADANPRYVYLDGDRVFDCDTQAEATWYAAWFNVGNADQQADHCMVNELRIEDPDTAREVVLRQWHAVPMEAESQDQWTGTADVLAADFAAIPIGPALDLVFQVNTRQPWRDTPEDNEVRSLITLFSSSACSSAPVPPLPPPPIRQISPNRYEVSRQFVLSLVDHPDRVLRGAPLAPEQVGAGFGFQFFMMAQDSLPRELGAMKGDILWRVDGNAIGPNTVTLALQRLLQGNEVQITLLRSGVQKVLRYRVP
jgi:hypothetical protein